MKKILNFFTLILVFSLLTGCTVTDDRYYGPRPYYPYYRPDYRPDYRPVPPRPPRPPRPPGPPPRPVPRPIPPGPPPRIR